MDLASIATSRLGTTLAIGNMALLGVFLGLDGMANIFPLVEHYMLDSKTGNNLVVLPLVIVAYLMGLGVMSVSHIAYGMIPGVYTDTDTLDFVQVARTGSGALIGNYLDMRREAEMLQGASVAMLIMSVGASVEVYQLPGYEMWVVLCSGLGVFMSATTPFLVRSRLRRMRELAKVVVDADWSG